LRERLGEREGECDCACASVGKDEVVVDFEAASALGYEPSFCCH
jgi:hypothetical protein